MKDLVIIGAGGLGREVAWLVEDINIQNNQSSPKCWCKFFCHNGYCYAAWFSNTSAEVLEKFWRAV